MGQKWIGRIEIFIIYFTFNLLMNLTQHNKFSKTVSQFYFEPLNSRALVKVNESGFIHKARHFRVKKAYQISQNFIVRR